MAFNISAVADQSSTGVSLDGATYSTPGIACNSNTATQISGAVWEDWDYNGAMNEEALTGVKGILVSLYNDSGNVMDATTTDINGDYSFSSLEISTMYRIEFSIPDSLNWAKPTQTGTDSKSMVQFVQSGNCANLGIAAPIDYCDNNPILFTPCYVNGEALGGTDAGTFAAMVGVAKNFSGDGFNGSDNNYAALGEQIGATWGVAVQASTQTVFTSSVLKRHVSFGPADNTVGTTTHTTGGIYAIDYSNPASPNTSLWLDLNTLSGIATGADPHTGLNGNPNQPNNDKGAFPEVAKMALGDLDISEDGKTLYVVNLNDKTLIEIDIATKTVQKIYSIPNPGCTNSDNTIEAAYHFSNTVGTINGSAIGTTWEDGYSLAGGPQWTINTPGLDFNPTDAPSSIFTGTIIGDNLSVPINVPNGNYEVSLYFRDYNNGIGQRVFDISLEGTVVLDDFDIEASNTAKWSFLNASNDGTSNNSYPNFAFISNQQTFTISVSDGTLNINLDKEASSVLAALLFGVKVKNLDTTPNPATDYRPWGIGINKGKIYLGAVCSGESSELRDDLSATVFELENGTFSEVLSFPLDYERGFLVRGPNDAEFPATWNSWNDDDTFANWQGFFGSSWYPLRAQPILSDIEFDNDDNMIVAFMDRTGHQIGYNDYTPNGTIKEFNFSGGDVLKACKAGETWNIEGSPACAQPFSGISGPFNYWGINGGEFYGEDYALLSTDANIHDETHWGGLVFDKTTNQLINTAYDTKYIANSGGFSWYDNANGTFIKGYEVYGNVFADPNAVLPLFGKANGLGDVEMLCAPAPLEIGNRLWVDTDNDGIQDACEDPLVGIRVTLFNAAWDSIGVSTTNAEGLYYFNKDTLAGNTAFGNSASIVADSLIQANSTYHIVVGRGQFEPTRGLLQDSLELTIANVGMGTNPDQNDSDGTLANGLNVLADSYPYAVVNTEDYGCNDHSFDFGFSLRPVDIELTKIADRQVAKIGENILWTLEVENQSNFDVYNVQVADTLPNSVNQINATATRGTYASSVWTIDTLHANGKAQLFITTELTKDTIACNIAQVYAFIGGVDSDSSPNNDDGDQSEDDEDKALVFVTPEIDLSVMKAVSQSQGAVGDAISYTITVKNDGPSIAHNVKLHDQLPAELTQVGIATGNSDQTAAVWAYTNDTLIIDSISVGETITLTVNATINSINGSITNCAEIVAADEDDVDSSPGNANTSAEDDEACVDITPIEYDIELLKDILKGGYVLGNRKVKVGEQITYVLRVTNLSSSNLTGVVVKDLLPAGVEFQSMSGDGTYDEPSGEWTIGNVSPKSQLRMDIVVKVTADGTISNTAEVSEMDQADKDSIPGNGVETEDDQQTVTMEVVKPKKKLEIKVGN